MSEGSPPLAPPFVNSIVGYTRSFSYLPIAWRSPLTTLLKPLSYRVPREINNPIILVGNIRNNFKLLLSSKSLVTKIR